jgi:hypothetical protein
MVSPPCCLFAKQSTNTSFVLSILQYKLVGTLFLALRYDRIMKISIAIIKLVAALFLSRIASAEKYTYSSAGRGGSATMGGGYCGDWPFDNYVDIYAAENASKIKANGKPETSVIPYMSVYFYLWTDCSADSATLIEPDWDNWYEPVQSSLSFPSDKLETGTAAGGFPAREIPCTLVTETYEDYEYVYYNCDYSLSSPVSVDIQATWTGTGDSYQDRSTSTYRYPSGFYKVSTKGKTRDATIALEVTIDDAPFDVEGVFGEESYKYGKLFKSTQSQISKYKLL